MRTGATLLREAPGTWSVEDVEPDEPGPTIAGEVVDGGGTGPMSA